MEEFTFEEELFNFWPVFECIQKYYPVGVTLNEDTEQFYRSYPGFIALEKIIVENIHNRKNLRERWTSFEKKLKTKFDLKLEGTTFGHNPSFSASLILENKKHKEVITSKLLHLAISLLGPYYTIFGIDQTSQILTVDEMFESGPAKPVEFSAINAITISPFHEFETFFTELDREVQNQFNGFKLIPFSINQMQINGLSLLFSERKNCTVFNALFHDTYEISQARIRGYHHYGFDNWRI